MSILNRNRVVIDSPNDAVTNAYMNISERIKYYTGNEQKVLAFMSTRDGDGKSTVATNVAISLAKLGGKVVYVDADFDNPSIHETFDMKIRKGVSDAIINDENVSYMIYDTPVYGLSIILAGTEKDDTGMILLSNKFKYLIRTLKNTYDYCIIDISSKWNEDVYMDALKECVDGIVIVDNQSREDKELESFIQMIERHNIPVIGTVNNMEKEH